MARKQQILALREDVREILGEYTTSLNAYNVVGLATELADLRLEVETLETMLEQLTGEAALDAAAKAFYEVAGAFSWDRLETSHQAIVKASMLAGIRAAKKAARQEGTRDA
jgi:hypothetical protein